MNFETSAYGRKTIPQVLKDVLRSVFDYEESDGHGGYVYGGGEAEYDRNLRFPLMNCYFIEPAIKAYDEVFQGRDESYANDLLALITRMTDFLISITYGGNTNNAGKYRPRQIPYTFDIRKTVQNEGQVPYILMAANAAGFLYSKTGRVKYLNYARQAFRDYVRYFGVSGGDAYIDPSARTPTSYNSSVYPDTESKVHGWSSRYGQYYLEVESAEVPTFDKVRPKVNIKSPRRNARLKPGFKVKGTASDNVAVAKLEYKLGEQRRWSRAKGLSTWWFRVPVRIKHRSVKIFVRALDTSGNKSAVYKRTVYVK